MNRMTSFKVRNLVTLQVLTLCVPISSRLHDVLHSDKKLTLVFEYCDQDLKKYFDSCNGDIDPDVVKVHHMGWGHGEPTML